MVEKYQVRWNPSQAEPVTFFGRQGRPVRGDLSAREATEFEFTTDDANSDLGVQGFKIRIAPNSPDIKVGIEFGTTVKITNSHSTLGTPMPLRMSVEKGGHNFVITGGKPVIRNEPNTFANPTTLVYVAVGIIVVAVIFYLLLFH